MERGQEPNIYKFNRLDFILNPYYNLQCDKNVEQNSIDN